MDTLKFRLNTVERSIILENIQMTQDRFSYNIFLLEELDWKIPSNGYHLIFQNAKLQYFPTQFPITLETGDT